MKKLFAVIFVSSLALFVFACIAANPTETFLRSAAHSGTAEVEMSKLAVQRGESEFVKLIAARIVEDHTKIGDELKQLMAKKNVTLPEEMTAAGRNGIESLQKLSGGEFDKAYLSAMLKAHETDINTFAEQATNGTDPEIKSFAEKNLPTLQKHLQMVKEIKPGLK